MGNLSKEQRAEEWQSMTPRERLIAQRRNDMVSLEKPDYNASLVKRAQKRMSRVDAMPADLRRVVYEYNLEIVQCFFDHGVKNAASIKYLIDTVLANPINGQNRFKLNQKPNSKSNPAAEEDEYWNAK